ncbi:MAG: hypothetical protein GXP26_12555 [Planctomycetes bacterium]|nr:hypothetical protein [Planctomycetota bacterium]
MDAERFQKVEWHEPTADLWLRIRKIVVKDFLILLALLITGELAVRFAIPGTEKYVYSQTVTAGNPIVLNSAGLRERPFPAQRPANENRILCLGNSTTFGTGIAVEDTYCKQLENLLERNAKDDNFFVINGGGEAGSLGKAIQFLNETGLAYEPAAVVLGFSPSMIAKSLIEEEQKQLQPETKRSSRSHGSETVTSLKTKVKLFVLKLHAAAYSSRLYVFLDANFRKQLYRLGVLKGRVTSPKGAVFAYAFEDPNVDLKKVESGYQAFEGRLIELKALLDEKGIPLLVMGIPSRFDLSEQSLDNVRRFDRGKIRIQPVERLAKFCENEQIPFLNLTSELKAVRRQMISKEQAWNDLYVDSDFTHLNTAGSAIAAEELYVAFQKDSRLNIPAKAYTTTGKRFGLNR